MSKDVKFEWYVLNDDKTKSEFRGYPYPYKNVIPWNVFNNSNIYEWTVKACEDYYKENWTFDNFVEEIRKIMHNQLWSRVQYEIDVIEHIHGDEDTPEKIDCYQQVLPNIRTIAKYVLYTYYPNLDGIEK